MHFLNFSNWWSSERKVKKELANKLVSFLTLNIAFKTKDTAESSFQSGDDILWITFRNLFNLKNMNKVYSTGTQQQLNKNKKPSTSYLLIFRVEILYLFYFQPWITAVSYKLCICKFLQIIKKYPRYLLIFYTGIVNCTIWKLKALKSSTIFFKCKISL